MSDFISSSFLFIQNAEFIEELMEKYLENPNSVDRSWHDLFKELSKEGNSVTSLALSAKRSGGENMFEKRNIKDNLKISSTSSDIEFLKEVYRRSGHSDVILDPLAMRSNDSLNEIELQLSKFAYSSDVTSIISKLKSSYSGRIGYEFMYIENLEERAWIQDYIEKDEGLMKNISQDERINALQSIMEVGEFERFLNTRFPGAKRFSIEGGEAAIAALDFMINRTVRCNVSEFMIAMAHRGRLSTLTKILRKSYHKVFYEFSGNAPLPELEGVVGDVKYHMGGSCDIDVKGKKIHIAMLPNPSHLESVDPVLLGRVRAKQDMRMAAFKVMSENVEANVIRESDQEDDFGIRNGVQNLQCEDIKQSIMPIVIHGDASVAGQGVVMESLMMSKLKAHDVGGALHFVINNQIGFTVNPEDSRFGRYCTDIAKSINAPVVHVNGSDVDAVLKATEFAFEYKRRFKKDVFVDIVCYRKYGHNEGDEPMFTQPAMYKKIHSQEEDFHPVLSYQKALLQENLINQSWIDDTKNAIDKKLEAEFEESSKYKPSLDNMFVPGEWSRYNRKVFDENLFLQPKTGFDSKKLLLLGKKLFNIPQDFVLHRKIAKQMEHKQKQFAEGATALDWSVGEALAIASLLEEGYVVRLTGEDVERGTFSHRHAVLFDQESQRRFLPMEQMQSQYSDNSGALKNNVRANQTNFHIYNSFLSEFGVLGFEYGYSTANPNALVIWEAQFGDFANGAQIVIDQYIASAEAKWMRMSNLVLLLPHGYEGQGPEHSSARLERFLQLCAMENMRICNCTTPASFFHALRRQMHSKMRKPLIVMTPKSLLRHKLAISDIKDFGINRVFETVIEDEHLTKNTKRVIFCSGKVYYDLYQKREELGKEKEVAVIRIEQLYPFDKQRVKEIMQRVGNAQFIWCQEEHYNMGAYSFVVEYFNEILEEIAHKEQQKIRYVGRLSSASPATGSNKVHIVEQKELVENAILN